MANDTPKPGKKPVSDLSLKKDHDDKVKGGEIKRDVKEVQAEQAKIEADKG